MEKKKRFIILFLLLFLILLAIMIIYIYFIGNSNRMVVLHDYRLTYSDTYKISSKADLHTIDKIMNKLNAVQANDSNNNLRIGGYVIIEEQRGDNIISYRIQGSYVTKYEVKNNELSSTTYYKLDDTYYQLLQEICDKHRKMK